MNRYTTPCWWNILPFLKSEATATPASRLPPPNRLPMPIEKQSSHGLGLEDLQSSGTKISKFGPIVRKLCEGRQRYKIKWKKNFMFAFFPQFRLFLAITSLPYQRIYYLSKEFTTLAKDLLP